MKDEKEILLRKVQRAIWKLDHPHVGRPGDLYTQAIDAALKVIDRIAKEEELDLHKVELNLE